MVKPEGPRAGVHETGVVKNSAARFFDNRESPFNRGPRHGLTTRRFAVLILGTDLAIWKAAEIVRSTKIEPLVNWNAAGETADPDERTVAAPVVAYRRDFAVDQQNGVPRQMEILRPFQLQSVHLDVASEKTPGNERRKGDPLAAAREQRVIARIKHNAGKKLTFESRACLRLDNGRCAGRDIKHIDVLQRISQSPVHVSIERFPHLDHESVIAL